MGHNRNLADYAHHFDGTHIDLGSGNIETQGVVTFEDVSNVDSVGIITARDKIKLTSADGQIEATGATGLSINASGASAYVRLYSANTERLRINANGIFDFKDNSFTNVGSIALDFIKGDADDDTNITFAGNDTITFKAGSTSPALTVNTTQVKVEDNQKFVAGAGNDLEIYHNGSDSFIVDNRRHLLVRADGSGDLYLQSDSKVILSDIGGNETFIECNDNGNVSLYYDNSKKFETTSDGVEVTGNLDLSAIDASISDTAVDVFVYDTRKDSDGGAWRKRTQHTSWYNETLGTSTRGSRKEFPAVAVIVTETRKVTIYDGDDPDLPMWMIFNAGSGNALYYPNSSNATSTVMLNGKLANAASGGSPRFRTIDFISDSHLEYSHTDGRTRFSINISQRNAGLATFNYGNVPGAGIIHRDCNDVAMTVLANAPIDDTTGLPVPTIVVATHSGLSIIKDDGTVIDGTSASGSIYSYVKVLTITEENYLWFLADYFNGYNNLRDSFALSLDTLPSSDFTWNNSTDNLSTGNFYALTTGNESGEIQIGNSNSWAWTLQERNALGGAAGFAIHKPNIGSENNSLFALITSDYNSGYMQGDCRGAFLADTDTTNKTNGQTDPDRSEYNYALSVTGTINKSAVATGADLVGYHGFSSSNYLRHTNGINYGNAATITMGGWSKISGSAVDANYRYLCSCRSSGIVAGLAIHIDQNNVSQAGKPYFYDITNSSLQSNGPRVDDDKWHHILGVLDGGSKKIYIDGELVASSTVTGINLSAVDITNVGHYVSAGSNTPNYNHGGYLALIKFSASAPTAEQVKKMYEEEKVLFQENAKCTLYGSSNAVTGLAYDDSTELYHVGTSAGRSEFQGLRRINNTTTAVTTAISASDELIAEQ